MITRSFDLQIRLQIGMQKFAKWKSWYIYQYYKTIYWWSIAIVW